LLTPLQYKEYTYISQVSAFECFIYHFIIHFTGIPAVWCLKHPTCRPLADLWKFWFGKGQKVDQVSQASAGDWYLSIGLSLSEQLSPLNPVS
jgi:hypothetical protein